MRQVCCLQRMISEADLEYVCDGSMPQREYMIYIPKKITIWGLHPAISLKITSLQILLTMSGRISLRNSEVSQLTSCRSQTVQLCSRIAVRRLLSADLSCMLPLVPSKLRQQTRSVSVCRHAPAQLCLDVWVDEVLDAIRNPHIPANPDA